MVAGGALAGVIVALLTVNEGIANAIAPWSAEHGIVDTFGQNGYHILGVLFLHLWDGSCIRLLQETNNILETINA